MTYKELLNSSIEYLKSYNKDVSVASYLLEYICGINYSNMIFKYDLECSELEYSKLKESLDLYIFKNIPVQYIVGYAPFYGRNFIVNNNVLIPRFETEELVEKTLEKYYEHFKDMKVELCDLCCGSGCIGITLKLEEPNLNVTLSDISNSALDVTFRNSKLFNVDVTILNGDMLEPLKGRKFDILVSNPPYIPLNGEVMDIVKDNEPNIALFGGDDGLMFYDIILKDVRSILNDNAIILFEHGYDQKDSMIKLVNKYLPDAEIYSLSDLEGKDRMTVIEIGLNK